jgi:putative FmdB family regulatory protein
MPVYEYKCLECGERFEVDQSMAEEPLTSIAGDDHTHSVKKVFSPVGISFKGSGFYRNDSAKKAGPSTSVSPNGSKDSESGSKEPAKKAESTGESSTASTSPSTPSTSSTGSSKD